jgi:hypothetical protein
MKYHYAIKAETTVKSWTNFKYKKWKNPDKKQRTYSRNQFVQNSRKDKTKCKNQSHWYLQKGCHEGLAQSTSQWVS